MSAPKLEDLIPPPDQVVDTHKVHSIAIACIALGVIGTLSVGVRVGVRVGHGNFGADDYAIVVAAMFYIAWSAFAAYSNLHAGIGKPLWEITVQEYSLYWQSILAATFLYPAMSGSIRISILLFYRRIFSPERALRRVLWFFMALQTAYIVAFSVTPAFICNPIWKIKYPLEILTSCDLLFYNANLTSVYVVSIAFDLTLAVLPIFFLSKLQMTRTRRLRAALIFVFGASWTRMGRRIGFLVKLSHAPHSWGRRFLRSANSTIDYEAWKGREAKGLPVAAVRSHRTRC
ncbi:hypothetical protein PG994_000955 [Apiospora phragmitis]|uniref:Rhodopsin domain-containing protein n=1 Tax=Apiospora phragmitis TaxID=2905665 RepID=A0ABR1WR38_9PEZI